MHILAIYRRIRPIRAVNDLRSDFITSFRCDELHRLSLSRAPSPKRRKEKRRKKYKKDEGREEDKEKGERFKRVAGDKSD